MQVIQQAKNLCQNSQFGPGAIAFEFAQVSPKHDPFAELKGATAVSRWAPSGWQST